VEAFGGITRVAMSITAASAKQMKVPILLQFQLVSNPATFLPTTLDRSQLVGVALEVL
jgi:hypothetical protein